MGTLAFIGILVILGTVAGVFISRSGEALIVTIFFLILWLIAATIALAIILSILYFTGIGIAYVFGWTWCFSMSLWDSSVIIRRAIFAPYYRRKVTLEAARLLKIRLALDAKINFVQSHWQQLQEELLQAKADFGVEHVNFDFIKKLDELQVRCQETVPNFISNERWDEAGPLLRSLMEELQALRDRRTEFKAKIPKLKASWQRIQETARRLIKEAGMLDISNEMYADLQELVNVIDQHGTSQLFNEDWDGFEQTIAAANESLVEHDHLSRLLGELDLSRDTLDPKTLKSAYKRMAKLHHPDLGESGCHEKMARINEAKTLLEVFLTSKSKVA